MLIVQGGFSLNFNIIIIIYGRNFGYAKPYSVTFSQEYNYAYALEYCF